MSENPTVVVAMPAFNEGLSIEGFLSDIFEAFSDVDTHVVVVDDCSSDRTAEVVLALAANGAPITLCQNLENLGHGPSTVRALRRAALLGPEFVIAADGDGNIQGRTLRALLAAAQNEATEIVIEGTRAGRNDPWFRKLVTTATRVLVLIHSGSPPRDANTPFRVYPSRVLSRLLRDIPENHLTPNLLIASILRKEGFPLLEMKVPVHKRAGTAEHGSTWKQRTKFLPSARFLKFCWTAAGQWIAPRTK
jgi:dolichol-phosphate mannosyltransferase